MTQEQIYIRDLFGANQEITNEVGKRLYQSANTKQSGESYSFLENFIKTIIDESENKNV